MTAGANALIFYAGVVALVAGTIRTVRAAVERKARDRIGVMLGMVGVVALCAAVLAFLTGTKTALPF